MLQVDVDSVEGLGRGGGWRDWLEPADQGQGAVRVGNPEWGKEMVTTAAELDW